jgi:hypothetical protein
MSFTEEENAALGALGLGFPVPLVDVMDVEAAHAEHYLKQVRNLAVNTLYYAKAYDMAVDPGLAAAKAVILEEKRKVEDEKLVARLVETRESLVSGIISGLMPKINRRLKSAKTSFFISADTFELYTASTVDRAEIDLVYQRSDFSVMMRVNDQQFHEDWTVLSGNKPMREQSEGYLTIVAFLEAEGVDD